MRRYLAFTSAICLSLALFGCTDEDVAPKRPPVGASEPRAGEVLWESPDLKRDGAGSAHAIGDGIVAVTATSTTRLDRDGQQLWTVDEAERRGWDTWGLVVGDHVVRFSQTYAGGGHTRVRVLDGQTGKVRWSRKELHDLTAEDGILYATSCPTGGCRVLALDSASGRIVWEQQVPAVSGIDLSGTSVVVTSYPNGTSRLPDPYAEDTRVDVFDQASGNRIGRAQTGNFFDVASNALIEHSYAGSRADACRLTLTARTFEGKELWDHTVTWTKGPSYHDCALQPLLLDRTDRVELTDVPKHHEDIDLRTGRVGPATGEGIVATADGVEVRVGNEDDEQARAVDANGATLWEAPAPGPILDAGPDHLAFVGVEDGSHTQIRSIRTGKVVLDVDGWFAGSGDDWLAVKRSSDESGQASQRLVLLTWPHDPSLRSDS